MPQIFDFLSGAGQGLKGAQGYFQRKQALERGELQKQAAELALERAKTAQAEEEAGRKREEGYREAMSQAVGTIQEITEQRASVTSPFEGVATPWGAVLGAGRTMAEVQSWLKGKDEPTHQAMSRLRTLAERVAKTDPDAAFQIVNMGAAEIKGRVVQAAVGRLQQKASDKIRRVGEMAANGRVSEQAASDIQDMLEQAMSLAEVNPQNMAAAENILARVDASLDAEMAEADSIQNALEELDWMRSRPGGFDAKILARAKRRIELGEDPGEVIKWAASEDAGWTGGPLATAPPRLRIQWEAKARSLAREFVTENNERGPAEEPSAYLHRLFEETETVLPLFRDQVHGENGVIPERMLRMPGVPGGGQPPATSGDLQFIQSPPAGGNGAAPAPGTSPESPPQKAVRTSAIKRRKSETAAQFVERVRQEIGRRGGTRENVLEVLEREGIKPEDLRAAPSAKSRKPARYLGTR